MTAVILFVMVLVVLSYREVVSVYTRAGGSYVVARENFGPRIAQVAAVALLIDYVVTVAVQTRRARAAVASAVPALGPLHAGDLRRRRSCCMCFGNLRGIREAGKVFALPTYLFSGSVILMIVVGIVREALGDLPHADPAPARAVHDRHEHRGPDRLARDLHAAASAFANGGSSLTGHRGGLQRASARSGRPRAATPGEIW